MALGLLGTTPPAAADAPAERPANTAESPAPGTAATEADALARAERTGHPVEILSLRGESTEVFATPEGTLEAREYLRPVRTRIDGAWHDIDTDLAARPDGTVAPGATTVDMAFSGGGSEAPMARVTRAGRTLELHWPGTLPAPELDGPVAVSDWENAQVESWRWSSRRGCLLESRGH